MRSQMLYHGTRQITFLPLFNRSPGQLDRSTSQAAHLGETRLELSILDGIVCQLTDCGVIVSFCRQIALNRLPASEAVPCCFVSFLVAARIFYGSVRSYLSAVHHHHIRSGHPDPSMTAFSRLEYVLKGLRCIGVVGP